MGGHGHGKFSTQARSHVTVHRSNNRRKVMSAEKEGRQRWAPPPAHLSRQARAYVRRCVCVGRRGAKTAKRRAKQCMVPIESDHDSPARRALWPASDVLPHARRGANDVRRRRCPRDGRTRRAAASAPRRKRGAGLLSPSSAPGGVLVCPRFLTRSRARPLCRPLVVTLSVVYRGSCHIMSTCHRNRNHEAEPHD